MEQSVSKTIEKWPFKIKFTELTFYAYNKATTMVSIGFKFRDVLKKEDHTPKNMIFRRGTFMQPKTQQYQRVVCKDGVAHFPDYEMEGKIERNIRKMVYLEKILSVKMYEIKQNDVKEIDHIDVDISQYMKYEKKDVSLKMEYGVLSFYITPTEKPPEMVCTDIIETFDDVHKQVESLNNDVEELKDTLVEAFEVKRMLLEKYRILNIFRIKPGEMYPEESEFIIKEVFLHEKRYNDEQKPILGDVIYKHIQNNKLFSYKMDAFFSKLVMVLDMFLKSTSDNPPQFIYYFCSTVQLLEDVKRIQPENRIEKQQITQFTNDLLECINKNIKMIYDTIVKSSDGHIVNFFLNFNEMPSLSMSFGLFFEYLKAMVKDKLEKKITHYFCTTMLKHIDRMIFNKLREMPTIRAEDSLIIKQRIADFQPAMKSRYKQLTDVMLPLTTNACDILIMDAGCLRVDDLKKWVCPYLSYDQVFEIADKRDPPQDKYFYEELRKEAFIRSQKIPADLSEVVFKKLTIKDIFGF